MTSNAFNNALASTLSVDFAVAWSESYASGTEFSVIGLILGDQRENTLFQSGSSNSELCDACIVRMPGLSQHNAIVRNNSLVPKKGGKDRIHKE